MGLKTDGYLVGWGDNQYGQGAVHVAPLAYTAMGIASTHVAAVLPDTSIHCWGSDDPTVTTVPAPNTGFEQAAAGVGFTVALRSDTSIATWGDNSYGQLGKPKPNLGIQAVAAGLYHSVLLMNDGSVRCFGDNSKGQCTVPSPNGGYAAVAAGDLHTLGLKTDGSVVCWGDNSKGQCDVPKPNAGFTAVSAGYQHSAALTSNGSVVCWGNNSSNVNVPPTPNDQITAIAAGYQHNLALRQSAVYAWGSNMFGQLNVPLPNIGYNRLFAGAHRSFGNRGVWRVSGVAELQSLSPFPGGRLIVADVRKLTGELTETRSAKLDADGHFDLDVRTPPPFTLTFSAPHFLTATVTVTDSGLPVAVSLINGDADGDNAVTLFDYLTLDGQFGRDDCMADLDGDGAVTLFDYLIIDRSFGAAGS